MSQRPKRIRLPAEAYANPDAAFHVVIRAHPEVGAFSTVVAEAVWASVLEQASAGRVELFAACLMPDHLHLLLRSKEIDVVAFMNLWKSWSTRVAWGVGHHGPVWQPSFYDRGLKSQAAFDAAIAYIVMNPVAAGLVRDAEDWPWTWTWYRAET